MWQQPTLVTDATDAFALLSVLLPADGHTFCVSRWSPQSRWRDTAVSDVRTLVSRSLTDSFNGFDSYFALASFKQGWHAVGTKNVFRKQHNVAGLRALWLDIDCGKQDSPYSTWQAAATALGQFLKRTKLPSPWIVLSGHGLHVYWPFVETIGVPQWRGLATMLKGLCDATGLAADHARTTDPASVLRVPGTRNYDFKKKYDGEPTDVVLAAKGAVSPVLALARTVVQAARATGSVSARVSATVSTPPVNSPAPSGVSFAMDSFDREDTVRHPYRIIKECEQIRTAGLGPYPQWYNMMLVMKHCAFGERAVHDISKTDRNRYDPDVTQSKFQQAVDGGYGPCRCDTFNAKTPGICTRCPYWGRITSPLQLGEPYIKPEPVRMAPPVVARVGDTAVVSSDVVQSMDVVPFATKEFAVVPGKGIVWHRREKVPGTGDEEDHYVTKSSVIADVEIYIHSLCVDATSGRDVKRSYVIRKKAPNRAPEDILFDVTNDLGGQSMVKWLANHGMMPRHPKFNKPMGDFMQTYLAAVQNKLPEIFVRDKFGWVENTDRSTGDNYDGFIVADRMFTRTGVEEVKLDERAEVLGRDFRSAGHLETWRFIPRMYRVLNQPFPALMMCASFAAPFMRYGNGVANNVAYSLWDIRGGKGKSTVLEACASVWGNPVTMLQTKSDTPASRFQKFAVYRNLPVFIDEITNMKDAEMSDLVYDIVNGREKSRSTASGTALAKQGQWSTVTLFSSNKSLYETLKSHRAQSEATCMRVVEVQCDFKDYTGTNVQTYISQVARTIRHNYGLAGQAFMQYCMAHPDVFDEVRQWADRFVAQHMASSDERFWLYGIAIPLAVATIAVRAGLLDYDVEGWLVPYVLDTLLPTLRKNVKTDNTSALNVVSSFLMEHLDCTLSVVAARRNPHDRNMQDTGAINGLDGYVKVYPARKLLIRHELDTGLYFVSSKAFTKWCNENNYSLTVTLQELTNQNIFQGKVSCDLGACVSVYARTRVMCLRFRIPEDLT